MSEVSIVSNLVLRLIGIAIAMGCAGTLYDGLCKTRGDVHKALSSQQLSYSKWNSRLQSSSKIEK